MLEINKIHQGDCLKLIKELPDNSVDCIITDPPYGINYVSNHYKGENPHKAIENDDTLFIPLDECWRVLKPTGAMFVFYSHKVPLVDERVRNVLIWVKNNWTAGDLFGDFGNQYECIAFMPKDGFKIKGKRYSNIWNFDRIPASKLKHPTQKPVNMLRRLVKCSTNEGDLVLDCFAGSGSTLVACNELNRKFIGFELDEGYVEVCNKRLSQKGLDFFKLGGLK